MSQTSFPHLLAPGKIGQLTLRNRIVVTAMGVSLAEEDGSCGERIIAFHEEHAKGGAGLVIVGCTGVAHPVGRVQGWQVAISDDHHIPGLARLADAVHRHGAKIAAQLHHGGAQAGHSARDGHPLWVPSIPEPLQGDFLDGFLYEELAEMAKGMTGLPQVKVMTRDDIALVVRQFAEGARRAKAAGFDAVEIHGGHGYVLQSFLSPKSNKRTDEYGGPLENRIRFLLDVVKAVRAEVGPDFTVWVKIDAREVGKEGGITLELAKETALLLEAAGVDAITVSAYHEVSQGKLHSASNIPHEPGSNLPASAEIKRLLRIPVIASGRVEPDVGDAAIGRGEFDFLGMGRKLLADPMLPAKLAAARPQDVRPCIYCYTCVSAIYTGVPSRCAVNPDMGFESIRLHLPRAKGARHVVVAGGGPAGMEAARLLANDGHRVTLVERGSRLGGTLQFASLAYPANQRLLEWLVREVEAADIDVRLDTAVTPELLHALAPDAVVVASGALRTMPAIAGADLPHVFSGDDMRKLMLGESSEALARKTSLLTRVATKVGAATGLSGNIDYVRQATRAWMPLGQRIAIIGGELVGLELAEFLTERGRTVNVIDEAPRFGAGLLLVRRMRLLAELREHGVGMHPAASNIRIEPDAVCFTGADGSEMRAGADHVIVAKGAQGDSTLAGQLRAAGFDVVEAGDCTGVGYIEGAIRGAQAAVDSLNRTFAASAPLEATV